MQTAPLTPAAVASLGKLADILDLIASLRNLSDPFSSPEALRAALEAFARLAAMLGAQADWLSWLRAIEDNPALLDLLVAAGRFVENLLKSSSSPSTPGNVTIQSIPLADWLTLITGLITLLQKLRATK